MNRKKLKLLSIGLGAMLLFLGIFGFVKKAVPANKIQDYDLNSETEDGAIIYSAGKLTVQKDPVDELFNVSVKSPLLIREVEMVQWYKDDKGVRMVLANYPLPSFEDNGSAYENPDFPEDIRRKVFYGLTTIGKKQLVVDESALKILSAAEHPNIKHVLNFVQYKELDEDIAGRYGLVKLNDSYVSASDDWAIGEIRVSFYYLEDDASYTLVGKKHTIEGIDHIESDDKYFLFSDQDKDIEEIRKDFIGDLTMEYLMVFIGLILIVFGILNLRTRTAKSQEEPEKVRTESKPSS